MASATARRVGLGAGIERALKEAVEWWNGEGPPDGLQGEEISLPARIARASADAARFDHLGGTDAAVDALRRRSGGILDPSIVETLTANADALLADTRAGDPRVRLLEVEPDPVIEIDASELKRVAAAFGDLADLKTPWTHGHSGGVAQLAGAAAQSLRLAAETLSRLELSARLQDVGRIAVSNVIWEKPGPLTSAEWEQARMHSYHSERILATSDALAPLARAAGMHHERLDGSGYYRGCRARELSPAVRILAAADAFHAMTQERPHRPALGTERAAAELQREVRAARSFRVVAYDRRGHGQSQRDVEGSRRDQEDDLAALIEGLGEEPANVVSTSFGASIGLGLASRRPDLVRSLIAHEPPLSSMAGDEPGVRSQLEAVLASVQTIVARVERGDALSAARQFVEEVALGPGAWEQLPQPLRETMIDSAPAFVAQQRDPMWASVELDELANIDCPLLLTQGDASPAWFRPIVAKLVEAIDDAEVHTYRGAGHAPHLTNPDDYLATVGGFLSRAPVRG